MASIHEAALPGRPPLLVPLASMVPAGSPTLPEVAAFGGRECAWCERLHSELWCRECEEETVGKLRVFYCSKACQDKHADMHRAVCVTRQRLCRAVSLLVDIWMAFGQETFSSNAVFVGERNRKVALRRDKHGPEIDGDWPGWTSSSILRRFPDDVFPQETSDLIKGAVLAHSTHTNALSVALPLINHLLRSNTPLLHLNNPFANRCAAITMNIQEVSIEPTNPAMIVHSTGGAFLLDKHQVLLVSMVTGEDFAVDLTGAQYGWTEHLYTWHTYEWYRAKKVERRARLGNAKQLDDMVTSVFARDRTAEAEARCFIGSAVMEGLCWALATDFAKHGVTFKTFVSQPRPIFDAERARLVGQLKFSLRRGVQMIRDQSIGRYYIDSQLRLRVTVTAEEGRRYRDVWLSEEEHEANKGDTATL